MQNAPCQPEPNENQAQNWVSQYIQYTQIPKTSPAPSPDNDFKC